MVGDGNGANGVARVGDRGIEVELEFGDHIGERDRKRDGRREIGKESRTMGCHRL